MKRFEPIIFAIFLQSFLLMPPAQANHKEVNGCGDDKGLGKLVPNQPVGVDFRPVCDNHDRCYGTLGQSKESCDNSFRSELRAKCEKTLLKSVGGVFGTVITGGGALASCYGVAEAYYRGVKYGGDKAYSITQKHAREEEEAGRTQTQSQKPVGYFDDGVSVFYSSGTSYCAFVSPKHYEFFRKGNPAPGIAGRPNPSSFGTNSGICKLPSGYFDDGVSVFFSAGNGTFCGFPNPTAYDSHRSQSQQPRFGRIDTNPNRFISYTGICQ